MDNISYRDSCSGALLSKMVSARDTYVMNDHKNAVKCIVNVSVAIAALPLSIAIVIESIVRLVVGLLVKGVALIAKLCKKDEAINNFYAKYFGKAALVAAKEGLIKAGKTMINPCKGCSKPVELSAIQKREEVLRQMKAAIARGATPPQIDRGLHGVSGPEAEKARRDAQIASAVRQARASGASEDDIAAALAAIRS